MEKHYHIYLKNKCLHYCLTQEEFNKIWNNYIHFSEIHKDIDVKELSYEEVVFNETEYSLQGL